MFAHALLLAASLVNPFVGTSGTKTGGPIDTFPGADSPLGMVQWSPDTPSQPAGGGYNYGDAAITGFSLTHLSGPGCSVFGDAAILPAIGAPQSPAAVKQPFSHAGEIAQPGYYAVSVGSPQIRVELTAAPRAGMARFTFPAGKQSALLVDAASNQAGVHDASVRAVDSYEIDGSATSGNFCGMPDTYTVYFALRFDRPALRTGVLAPGGPHAAAYAQFDTSANRAVTVRAAVSWVSIQGARANLATAAHQTFDGMRADAASRWNSYLNRIRVAGGTPEQQQTFYTALYHVLLHPNLYSDADGRYRGFDGAVHRVRTGHDEYANVSGWDVYRTQIPLLALIAPHQAGDMMQSLVDAAAQGGWLPKWSLANGYTAVMGGDSADPIIAGAYAFGARDFDVNAALAAMIKNASDADSPAGQGWYRPRPGLEEDLRLGYVVNAHTTNVSPVRNGASLTLEYALDDFSIAQFARALGEVHDYRVFMGRSQHWRNLFDTSLHAIAPRDASGAFEQTPITPSGQSGFQEGNAAQYTWMVPYDAQSLIYGMGGRAQTIAALDRFFSQINAGQEEPYAWLGNEPSLGAPWMYLDAGAPWKTQDVIRRALTTLYADTPDGIPGNDDLGTMSAWYVWCALGLYPANPAVRAFDIGAPLFSKIAIAQPNGVRINIAAAGAPAPYVQSVRIGGLADSRTSIALPERGTLNLAIALGARPSMWGTAAADAPPSYRATLPEFPPSTNALIDARQISLTLAPGARANVTLGVRNAGSQPISWQASAPPGVHIAPSTGTIRAAPQTLSVSADAGIAPGAYPIVIRARTPAGALLPAWSLAAVVEPEHAHVALAYAPNYGDNDVTAFDPKTGAIVAQIPVGKNPGDAALSTDGSRVYVPDQASADVSVIDTSSNRVVANVKVGKVPASLRISPDGTSAWVTNYGDDTVQQFDLQSLQTRKAIPVGHDPEELAIAPDGAMLYVADQGDGAVTPVDVRSGTALAPISVGAKPSGIVISPDGSRAYVSDSGSNLVAVIDLARRAVVQTIPAGVQPGSLVLSPDARTLYVADAGSDTVSVIDTMRGKPVRRVRVGLNPAALALSPGGRTLYAVLLGDNACVKISIGNPSRRSSVELGNAPLALALP